MNLEIKNLFDLSRTVARDLFEGKRYPWEVLPEIREAILKDVYKRQVHAG